MNKVKISVKALKILLDMAIKSSAEKTEQDMEVIYRASTSMINAVGGDLIEDYETDLAESTYTGYRPGKKVSVINVHRKRFNSSLREAKAWVEGDFHKFSPKIMDFDTSKALEEAGGILTWH